MDSTTLTTDKVELATISRDEADGGRVGPPDSSAENMPASNTSLSTVDMPHLAHQDYCYLKYVGVCLIRAILHAASFLIVCLLAAGAVHSVRQCHAAAATGHSERGEGQGCR